MTTPTYTPTTGRQTLVNGLHALADFLAVNPHVPAGNGAEVHYCVRGEDDQAALANLTQIAATLGVQVTATGGGPVTEHTTHFQVCRRFGPVTYRAIYVTDAAMAAYEALMTYSDSVRADRPAEQVPA